MRLNSDYNDNLLINVEENRKKRANNIPFPIIKHTDLTTKGVIYTDSTIEEERSRKTQQQNTTFTTSEPLFVKQESKKSLRILPIRASCSNIQCKNNGTCSLSSDMRVS